MNIILIIILLVIILILIWALFGGKGDIVPKEEESRDLDQTLRRRAADKEIEKEFPESPAHPRRRKSDGAEEPESLEPDKPFKLPYLADEIIPESSRFRIYRRTLLNSEIYASKGDFKTAISLYDGVRSRIQDVDTRFKIDANIEYLKHYKKKKEEDAKRKEEAAKRGESEGGKSGANEIKITLGGAIPDSINIDSVPQHINIGVIDPSKSLDMDTITENVARKLHGEISDVKDELSRMKNFQPVGVSIPQPLLIEQISGLKDSIQKLEFQKDFAALDAGIIAKQQSGTLIQTESVADSSKAPQQIIEELANLKDSVHKLEAHKEISGVETSQDFKQALATQGSVADISRTQQRVMEELAGLKDSVHKLESNKEMAGVDAGLGFKQPSATQFPPSGAGAMMQGTEIAAEQALRQSADNLADLKKEMRDLGRSMREIAASKIAEVDKEPALTEAKFDSKQAMRNAQAVADILGKMPKQSVPESTPLKGPEATSSEKIVQKKETAEEKEDFELLSEYGKEQSGDELTDEEIFEKILREDKKSKEKDGFEIIGEKKESRDDWTTTTEEMESRDKENDTFYRKLLTTTKRKKKELPILKVSYDFSKLPDEIGLSREKNIIEYAFYKYKPMLEKANDFIKKRKVRDAINYYKVVMSQNIPPEFKSMIRKNLNDLTEYLEKYLTGE